MYVAIAVVFIALGAGSIRAKRWARSLTLLLSWLTLTGGAVALVFLLFFARNLLEQVGATMPNDPIVLNLALIITYVVITVFFIVIPGIFILVYRSESVIKTVQKYDSKESWTDKCPLPLLAQCFFLLYMSIVPIFAIFYGFLAPLFGILLHGLAAALLLFANSIISVYLAIQVYRLNIRAWYYALYQFLFWVVSAFITFLYNDYSDIYKYMNIPADQAALMEDMGYLSRNNILTLILLSFISYLIFFFYAKKYFKKGE